MESKRRFQILSIIDGVELEPRILQTAHLLDQFRESDRIWAWLVKNRVTGKRFKTLCQEEEYSPLRILARINKAIVEEFTVKP